MKKHLSLLLSILILTIILLILFLFNFPDHKYLRTNVLLHLSYMQ